MPPDLRRGRIVWARISDRNGVSKTRPVVVLTGTDAISRGGPLTVMAVTTTFADPPPADHVELPWHRQGHPVTKLTQRSAAVLSWLATVMPDDVEDLAGDVPTKLMIEIIKKLDLGS